MGSSCCKFNSVENDLLTDKPKPNKTNMDPEVMVNTLQTLNLDTSRGLTQKSESVRGAYLGMSNEKDNESKSENKEESKSENKSHNKEESKEGRKRVLKSSFNKRSSIFAQQIEKGIEIPINKTKRKKKKKKTVKKISESDKKVVKFAETHSSNTITEVTTNSSNKKHNDYEGQFADYKNHGGYKEFKEKLKSKKNLSPKSKNHGHSSLAVNRSYTSTNIKHKVINDSDSDSSGKREKNRAIKDFLDQEALPIPNELQFKRDEVLNRNTISKISEEETVLYKKDLLENISLSISLKNIDTELLMGKEVFLEVLFTNTENIQDFFTIGFSKLMVIDGDELYFPDDFFLNFLFERTQYIRIIIYLVDGVTSEITFNLAKAMRMKLANCHFPVSLRKKESILFTENMEDPYKELICFSFRRITEGLDEKIPSIYLDFQFHTASLAANRLYYEFITESYSGELNVVYKSNEMMGKGPLNFAVFTLKEEEINDFNIKNYIFEFYEAGEYFGQVVIVRTDFEESFFNNEGGKSNRGNKSNRSVNDSYNTRTFNVSNLGEQYDKENEAKSSRKNLPNLIFSSGKKNMYSAKSNNKLPTTIQVESSGAATKAKEGVMGKAKIGFKLNKKMKLFDHLLKDMVISFDIAIDFTSSNLDPKDPNSLHTFNFENNKYVKAIKTLFKVLKEFDDDQLFPVFGFGGVPANQKAVSHCFNLSGNKEPQINGMDEVLKCYQECINTTQFVGPTYFSHILRTVAELIKKMQQSVYLSYHIFLILTDGKIEDMNETRDVLVEISKLPISIIIVGIGDADFGKMKYLGNIIN